MAAMPPSNVAERIMADINTITEILNSRPPGHPDIIYYRDVLNNLFVQLRDVQRVQTAESTTNQSPGATNTSIPTAESSSLAVRKRSLGPADVPEAKRISANPSPLTPGTPDSFSEGLGAKQEQQQRQQQQQQWPLPNHTAQNDTMNQDLQGSSRYIDLTGSDPPTPDYFYTDPFAEGLTEPFPELRDAYCDDGVRPGPADAFLQEWMPTEELAQFLLSPVPADAGYGLQQHRQQENGLAAPGIPPESGLGGLGTGREVPYLRPGLSEWTADLGDLGDYGDFPINAVEADAIEKMLETVQQNDEDHTPEDREQTPRIMKSTLKEYQKIGLTWLLKMEEGHTKGGILADEMGLGKTVQALALICARPSQDARCKTTLVIAPVALMRQWEKEIAHHVHERYKLSVYLYWGSKGKKADYNVLRQYDVVLTTFGTLMSEFKQKDSLRESMLNEREERDPRFRRKPQQKLALLGQECMWYRIIIDEAHNIKNRNAICSKASVDLQAKHRLCMTGTPMMNSIEELYPLLRFLRVNTYDDWRRFSQDIAKPIKHTHPETRKKAINRVQILLKAIMLRRQKSSEVDGKPILQLPPKRTTVDNVEFSDDEFQIYKALEAKSQIQFNKYLKNNTISSNYACILVLLLRLRQACCHPHLIKDLSQPATEGIAEDDLLERARYLPEVVVERLQSFDSFECPICFEADPNPTIIVPCGHTVCGLCVQKLIDPARSGQENGDENSAPKCPHCRGELHAKLITDFKHFCRVHCPERLEPADRVEDDKDSDDSDSDSDDFDDDDEETDGKGNLAGFVVSDDDEDEDEADSSPRPSTGSAARTSDKKSKGKSNSKAKGKGKMRVEPKKTLAQLKKESLRNKAAKKKYLRRLKKDWIPSAKILRTLEVLENIRKNDPTEKTLIFSQFTSLLDLTEVPLLQKKFRYQRYDGSMTMEARADAVEAFMENPEENIMLVSLKAGNAGLNLWRASQVIILDPFWNPFVEEQAVDRAHRMPQEREVTVHRVLVPETVEDRICALQDQKRELIGQALDEKEAKSLTRLGLRELKYLFGLS